VGKGQDIFFFDWNPVTGGPDQSVPAGIGQVTITGFNPSKDVIVLQQALATDFSHLTFTPVNGNTVVTINGDTLDQITFVGVHSSDLHQSDFQFI